MALPTSGQLTLAQIRDEFGAGTTSNVSLRTLSAAAGLSVPDGLNEFYGLSAYTPPAYVTGANAISGAGTAANPYIVTRNSWNQDTTNYTIYPCNEFYTDAELVVVGRRSWYNGIEFENRTNVPQTMHMTITNLTYSNFGSGCYAFLQWFWQNGPTPGVQTFDGTNATAITNSINYWQNRQLSLNNTSVGRRYRLQLIASQDWKEQVVDCNTMPGYVYNETVVCGGGTPSLGTLTFKLWFTPV